MPAIVLGKYHDAFPVPSSNQKINDYLKEVGKLIPKLYENGCKKHHRRGNQQVDQLREMGNADHMHTARRNFATSEFLVGTLTLTIMGSSTEKAVTVA